MIPSLLSFLFPNAFIQVFYLHPVAWLLLKYSPVFFNGTTLQTPNLTAKNGTITCSILEESENLESFQKIGSIASIIHCSNQKKELTLMNKLLLVLLVVSSILLPNILYANAVSKISWEVQNNFRLLKDPTEQVKIKTIALESKKINAVQEKIKEITLGNKRIEEDFFSVNDRIESQHTPYKTYYNKDLGIYDSNYISPETISVKFKVDDSNLPDDAICRWTINGTISKAPCNGCIANAFFDSQNQVHVTLPDRQSISETITIKDFLIIAFGDSYSSGEGNPDVIKQPGRKAMWFDKKRHSSVYAWPVLTAARLAAENPTISVTVINRSCSGAMLKHLYEEKDDGAPGEEEVKVHSEKKIPDQLTVLLQDLKIPNSKERRSPDLIFVSGGGNDANFAETLKSILLFGKVTQFFDKLSLKSSIRNKLIDTVEKLKKEYKIFAGKLAQNEYFKDSKIILGIYPDPVHATPTSFCGNKTIPDVIPLIVTQNECIALYDDFIMVLTGNYPEGDSNRWGLQGIVEENLKRENNYINWDYVVTRKIKKRCRPKAEYPDYISTDNDKKKCDEDEVYIAGYHQEDDYITNSFCLKQNDNVGGRWFLTHKDSRAVIGTNSGTLHPNIYGQLYYVNKVYDKAKQVLDSKLK